MFAIYTCIFTHLFADANAYLMAHFGSGYTVIHLDDVTCTGNETSLLHCSYDIDTADCSHAQDAGVRCTPVRKFEKLNVHSNTCAGFQEPPLKLY